MSIENIKKISYYVGLLVLSFGLFIWRKGDTLIATMLLAFATEEILENCYLKLENNNLFNFRNCFCGSLLVGVVLFFINQMYSMLFIAICFLPFIIGIVSIGISYENEGKKIMKKGFLRAIIVVILSIIGVTIAHFCPNLKIEDYLTLDYFFSFFFMTIVEILKLIKDFLGIE